MFNLEGQEFPYDLLMADLLTTDQPDEPRQGAASEDYKAKGCQPGENGRVKTENRPFGFQQIDRGHVR